PPRCIPPPSPKQGELQCAIKAMRQSRSYAAPFIGHLQCQTLSVLAPRRERRSLRSSPFATDVLCGDALLMPKCAHHLSKKHSRQIELTTDYICNTLRP